MSERLFALVLAFTGFICTAMLCGTLVFVAIVIANHRPAEQPPPMLLPAVPIPGPPPFGPPIPEPIGPPLKLEKA